MASKTFYLKYRPQKIAELDLVDIRQGLEKVLKSGKVPHAFLFAGHRGTGKTSAARIVAKAINCERRLTTTFEVSPRRRRGPSTSEVKYEPCNQCTICKEITAGSALDLLEIDAASNRGIDDIRNLREKIKLSPARAKYKVYIIDEVHMLTTEAFNALLKTLEEPPAHAVFILCTTAPEKLPGTIISRCLRFNFEKANLAELMTVLKRAVKGERLKPEKGVLEEIAKSADGIPRDAHKLLEQLSFSGKKITLKETKELLGKIEALSPGKLLSLLATKKTKAALLEIDRIVEAGGNLAVYTQEILDCLRQAMLAKVGLEKVSLPKEMEEFSLEEIKLLIQLFSRAVGEMKTNPIPQLPLELVVVEWCEKQDEGARDTRRNFDTDGQSATDFSLMSARRNKNIPPGGGTSAQIRSKSSSPAHPSSRELAQIHQQGNGLEEIKKRWDELLAGVKPLNHSVEALLRAARPTKMDGEFLILEVFYKFHKERLETEKCRSVVEEVAGQILGMPIRLRCILGQKRDNTGARKNKDRETRQLAGTARKDFIGSTNRGFSDSVEDDIMKTAEEIFGV